MMGLLIGLHVFFCVLLIIIILIQAGRGGGLVEGFSGVESMFGPKTNAFLTKATTILSTLFFVSCVGLALLSARQSRSLMSGAAQKKVESAQPATQETTPEAKPVATEPVPATPKP